VAHAAQQEVERAGLGLAVGGALVGRRGQRLQPGAQRVAQLA